MTTDYLSNDLLLDSPYPGTKFLTAGVTSTGVGTASMVSPKAIIKRKPEMFARFNIFANACPL